MFDVSSEGVEDGHVIRLFEEGFLETLEHCDGVTEQNLRGKNKGKKSLKELPSFFTLLSSIDFSRDFFAFFGLSSSVFVSAVEKD